MSDGMIGDACEDVGEVGLRVDAVHLGGLDDGVEAGGALAAGVGAAEEIVLPAQNQGPHGALGGVVRHLQPAVGDVAGQRLPARRA